MNSLPRWLGRRAKAERVDHVVEGRGAGGAVVQQALSAASSAQSLGGSSDAGYSEHSFNESLYVNGQVPRGQFKEFFQPAERAAEAPPAAEPRLPPKPKRTFAIGAADSSYFSRNVTLRQSSLSMREPAHAQGPTSLPVMQRAASQRASLRKAHSVDTVLEGVHEERFEDTLNTLIGSPNKMGLPPSLAGSSNSLQNSLRNSFRIPSGRSHGPEASFDHGGSSNSLQNSLRNSFRKHSLPLMQYSAQAPEEEADEGQESAYYNVQFARKARSSSTLQHQLTRQSLKHHDSNYIDHLIRARQADPFGTSFLGHSLVTDRAEQSFGRLEVEVEDDTLESTLIENTLLGLTADTTLQDGGSPCRGRPLQSTLLNGGSAADSGAGSLASEHSVIGTLGQTREKRIMFGFEKGPVECRPVAVRYRLSASV
jgi:hypothetical protein